MWDPLKNVDTKNVDNSMTALVLIAKGIVVNDYYCLNMSFTNLLSLCFQNIYIIEENY